MEWIPLVVRGLTALVGLMIGFKVPVRRGSLSTAAVLIGVGLIVVVVGPLGLGALGGLLGVAVVLGGAVHALRSMTPTIR